MVKKSISKIRPMKLSLANNNPHITKLDKNDRIDLNLIC